MSAAVLLINPKYPHNVGGALRACAAFGVNTLNWTGERVQLYDPKVKKKYRLPREERMRGYNQNVQFSPIELDQTLDLLIRSQYTPVAVEVRNDFESMVHFDHLLDKDVVYVFGPEDGSIGSRYLSYCHRHIYIPAHFCLNLAACVNVVLWDRYSKRVEAGQEPVLSLGEMLSQVEIPEHMLAGFEGR